MAQFQQNTRIHKDRGETYVIYNLNLFASKTLLPDCELRLKAYNL